MKNDDSKIWLARAESSFAHAKVGRVSKKIMYEDLCFNCQQAAEKAIKAILVHNNWNFPWTHDIEALLKLLKSKDVDIPPVIFQSEKLYRYATKSRYPGDEDPVTAKEYKEALKVSEKVLKWAKAIIEKKGKLL